MSQEEADMDVIKLEGELLRPEQVGQILGVGRTKLYSMVRQGELPVVRIGRLVRIPRAALDAWIAERIQGSRVA